LVALIHGQGRLTASEAGRVKIMYKRVAVLGSVIGLAALGWGVGPATASSAASHEATGTASFQVTAIDTEQSFLDLGASGTSLGDQIIFSGKLMRGKTVVGHQDGVCTVTSVTRAKAQCIATYSFGGSQITAQTLISLGGSAPYLVAVTGGTGRYNSVEGQIRVQPVSATTGVLTFHLNKS
jgi:hypothetical protein